MNTRQEYPKYLLDIYNQVNFVPLRGSGSRLIGEDGREIIDLAGGIAVNALGHSHPGLNEVLLNQSNQLWHVSNFMVNKPVVLLAKYLVEHTCFDKAFFCNSGTEAIEAALKLARRYARVHHHANKNKILAFKNAFHGRTLFSVTVGGQSKYSEDFAPLPGGIIHGEYNNLEGLAKLIDADTAAVIVEPIQAEGGVIPATLEFLQELRILCNQHNALLIFDEVQTGVGRTGKFFAYQDYSVEPDLICIAKALGGGFPIGGVLLKEKFNTGFAIGSHGTTFGGNPLAASVANFIVNTVNTPEILAGVTKRSELVVKILQSINDKYKIFKEIRGKGLLIGAELIEEFHGMAREIMVLGYDFGVATLIASPNVCRFTPALNIPLEDIEIGLDKFGTAIKQFLANN